MKFSKYFYEMHFIHILNKYLRILLGSKTLGTNVVMPQFDWLCDVCGCVMSPTSGIY